MPTLPKNMKKQQYFKEIAETAANFRRKGEYSAKEMGAYNTGQTEAYKEVFKGMFPKEYHKLESRMYSRFEIRDLLLLSIRKQKESLVKARRVFLQQRREIDQLRQGDLFKAEEK